MSETKQYGIVHVSAPSKDINSADIRTFKKITKTKTINVPYVPQPVVHRFLSDFFGINISIESKGYDLVEYEINISRINRTVKKTAVVRSFRFHFQVETPHGLENRFIDVVGACELNEYTNLNKALHSAETFALKELLKILGRGLEAYEAVESQFEETPVDFDITAEPEENLDSLLDGLEK